MSGQPPHDLDAERAVLGALLSGADLAGAGPLASMDFYRPAHALIFEAVCALDSGGRPRDPVAVGDELRQRGALGRMGGAPYLITCMQACPAPASAGYYAGIVRDHARRRRLIEVAARLHQTAMAPGDPDTLAERVSEISGALASEGIGHSDTSPGSIRGLLTGKRDGAWLGVQEFAPLRYHIPGIIAEGVTVSPGRRRSASPGSCSPAAWPSPGRAPRWGSGVPSRGPCSISRSKTATGGCRSAADLAHGKYRPRGSPRSPPRSPT